MADILNIEGFLLSGLSTNYATWAGTTANPDSVFTNFDFLDNSGNDNNLIANTTDRIVVNGTAYQVTSIGRPTIRLHFDDGTSYDVPNTAGASATGFRSYYLSNGQVVIRPLDSTISDPNVQPFSNWASIEILNASALGSGTTMTAQDDPFVLCFALGTRLLTPSGYRRVEDLSTGDLLQTADNGPHPIRWIGKTVVARDLACRQPGLRPVVIRTSAVAPGLPECDVVVSANHRLLVRNRVVTRMFGTDEALCAAKFLTMCDGIGWADIATDLEYFHVLMDNHEVIIAEGLPCESLYLGDQAMTFLTSTGRDSRNDEAKLIETIAHRQKPGRLFMRRRTAARMLERLGDRNLCEVPEIGAFAQSV